MKQRKPARYDGYDEATIKLVMMMERLFRCPRCIKQAKKHGHSLSQCGHLRFIGKKNRKVEDGGVDVAKPFLCAVCRLRCSGERVFKLITRRLNKGLPPLLTLLLISQHKRAHE